MDRQQISVKLTLDSLGLSFKIDSFQNRLIMQKTVYLAQAAGVQLGYFYQWYLHGPYSPSLTRDEYAIAMDISADMGESKGWTLDEVSLQRLKAIKPLFKERDQNKLALKLELLASVHFLIDRKQVSKIDPDKITETLKRYNKPFNKREVVEAIEELRAYGLLAA
jgi:uncharacterized protein YwgA